MNKLQDMLKNVKITGNNKIIIIVIFINVIIIGIYLIPEKNISAYYVITPSDNDHDLQKGRPGHAQRFVSNLNDSAQKLWFTNGLKDGPMTNKDDVENSIPLWASNRGLPYPRYDEEGKDEPFLYSPAFPKKHKPFSLAKWTPAHDTRLYFQPIDSLQAWAFSAFYVPSNDPSSEDREGRATVRILITSLRRLSVHMYCHLYNKDRQKIYSDKGKRKSVPDGHGTLYAPSFLVCPIPHGISSEPHYVSVTQDPDNDQPTNQVKIHYPGPRTRDFAVCFPPLHSNYNFTAQLVEAIEFNQLLGASHFFVYNFSISPETDAILRGYESDGLVTIVQWRLPHLEMWYFGQVMALNDCLYHNRGTSKYVVISDTDEIIIPHHRSSWAELMQDLTQNPSMLEAGPPHIDELHQATANSKVTAWSFRCSFYSHKRFDEEEWRNLVDAEFTSEEKTFLIRFQSRTMLDLKRLDQVLPHGKRSKSIVKPENVESGGIHFMARLNPGFRTAYVTHQIAMLHHYREFQVKACNTLDLSVLRFKDEYVGRLKKAAKKFPLIFPDPFV